MPETVTATFAPPPTARATTPGYDIAIGYLRAFITLLVVAHHAVLAYHPSAPPARSLLDEPRWWMAFPIVDSQRWAGFSALVGFNDTFFMSLMFFLSGLFVWKSLQHKGIGKFLRDRGLRLGLPFILAAALLAPLAYFPAYLVTGADSSVASFAHQWLSLGQWPSGPAWFVWLLLAFDCVAALLFLFKRDWMAVKIRRPAVFFMFLVVVSALAYVPMTLAFGPLGWTTFGPFTFQTSRLFHYAAYFLIGVSAGAIGIQGSLFARRWLSWSVFALFAFGLATIVVVSAAAGYQTAPLKWGAIGGFAFVLSCAASTVAFLALFFRFARKPVRIFVSLRDNAYGVYLIHYIFVTWLQYAMLRAPLSGLAKGSLVFLGALALSWSATATLRRLPSVARVI
jgi:peptidoglycan/LPS O-acetylase OafA/YrhL